MLLRHLHIIIVITIKFV